MDGRRSQVKLSPLLPQLRLMLYLLNDWVLKLLGTPPLPDAGQAVCVIAVGENPKSPLRSRRLFEDHFHADTAHFVLTCLEGKGLFHLVFECRHADLKYRKEGNLLRLWAAGERQEPGSSCQSHCTAKIRKEHGPGLL